MAIEIKKNAKLITVLASQANKMNVNESEIDEANAIIAELAEDLSPENCHKIAQVIAYTVERMQQGALDFLGAVADQKNIAYGDKAAFNVKTGGIKAYFQAKGSTTPRSFVSGKQILVETEEVSARPAINLVDLRTKRVQMSDLIHDANVEMTNAKLKKVEQVLQAGVQKFESPFFATGSGISKNILDKQLAYFRRLGPVTILGDIEAVAQLSGVEGMKLSDNMMDELNDSGFLGKYNGCNVVAMKNAYEEGQTEPILKTNWLYILPGSVSGDTRNLKLVNEGGISAMENQDINDLTFEIRLDQWFGAAFVTGRVPTIGTYQIG